MRAASGSRSLDSNPRRCRRLYRRFRLNLVGLGTGSLEVILHLGFQVFAARSEDRLHPIANHDHSGCAERFEFIDTGLRDIVQLHAQARDAGIEAHDVAAAAESADELQRELIAAACARADFAFLLTSRPGVIRLNWRMANGKTP